MDIILKLKESMDDVVGKLLEKEGEKKARGRLTTNIKSLADLNLDEQPKSCL